MRLDLQIQREEETLAQDPYRHLNKSPHQPRSTANAKRFILDLRVLKSVLEEDGSSRGSYGGRIQGVFARWKCSVDTEV